MVPPPVSSSQSPKGNTDVITFSEGFYKHLVASLTDAVMVLDVESGRVLDANPAACELTGRTLETLRGKDQQELYPPEHRDLAKLYFREESGQSGTRFNISRHLDILGKNGKRVPVEINYIVLENEQTSLLVGVFRNDTDRRVIEAELRQRDRLLKTAAESIFKFIHSSDQKKAIIESLRSIGEVSGSDRAYIFENRPHPQTGKLCMCYIAEWCRVGVEAFIDDPVFQYLPYEGGLEEWARKLESGQAIAAHVRELAPEARELLEKQQIRSLLLVPIVIEGKWWGYIGFDQCSHERLWEVYEIATLGMTGSCLCGILHSQRLHASIMAAEQRMRLAAIAGHSGVWEYNCETGRINVDQSFSDLLGYTQEQLGTTTDRWNRIVPPEERPALEAALQKCMKGEHTSFAHEHRALHANRSIRWLIMRGELIKNEDGSPLRILGISTDITDFKAKEKELLDAKMRAEEANRAKSEFMAMMSHEIRTPLNAILGFTDLLGDTQLDTQQAEYCRDIVAGGQTLLAVINQILDHSRLEISNNIRLELVPADLRDQLETTMRLIREKAAERGLSLSIQVDNAIPDRLLIDAERLRQVINNLLLNAIKFTDKGDVRLQVSLKALQGDVARIAFIVTDTGVGIPHEKQSTIFDPFVQVDSSLTRSYGGVGLGLTICRRIVELMGGTIGVESTPGKGSTFTFVIPCKVTDQDTVFPVEHVGQLPLKDSVLRVIYAEDSQANSAIMKAYFKSLDLKLDCVGNGRELVDKLREHTYDVVLMDIQMPEMDGFEATRLIRSGQCGESNTGVYIIGVTAAALSGDRERCLAAGMDDYLAKPLKRAKLFAALGKVIKERHP